jgi:hypothetical protein
LDWCRVSDGASLRGCALLFSLLPARAQGVSDLDLARELASPDKRKGAIAELLPDGKGRIPALLSWIQSPPADVDEYELRVGLADAFGQLKQEEAIPFLIRCLKLRRVVVDFFPFLKAEAVIEDTFPVVSALIKIGPEGSKAAMHAYTSRAPLLDAEERLCAIVVVSHVRGVREALDFLRSVIVTRIREGSAFKRST